MFFSPKPKTSEAASKPPRPPHDEVMAEPVQPATNGPEMSAMRAGSAERSSETGSMSPQDAKRRASAAMQMWTALGEIVMLLMRSEQEKRRPLAELQKIILPAVGAGQFAIANAQSKTSGSVTPVGAVLWAMVSPEVDARLAATTDATPQLEPNEWRSGDIPWITMVLGDRHAIAGLLKELTGRVFKDKHPKIRLRNAQGTVTVGTVQLDTAEPPQKA